MISLLYFSVISVKPPWVGPDLQSVTHSKHTLLRRRTFGPSRTFSPRRPGLGWHHFLNGTNHLFNIRKYLSLGVLKIPSSLSLSLLHPRPGRTKGPPSNQVSPSIGSGPQVPTNWQLGLNITIPLLLHLSSVFLRDLRETSPPTRGAAAGRRASLCNLFR